MTDVTVRGMKGMKSVMDLPVMQVRTVTRHRIPPPPPRRARDVAARVRRLLRPPPRAKINPRCLTRAPLSFPISRQDGPPPGGYPSVRYARRIPSTGPTGIAFFGAYLGAMVYGFYQIGQGNARRRGLKEEKQLARAVLIPFLQAEEDRRYAAALAERVKAEDKIMAGVPGWKSGDQGTVYNTTWLPPHQTYAPRLV